MGEERETRSIAFPFVPLVFATARGVSFVVTSVLQVVR
jgi:hypothetical protein